MASVSRIARAVAGAFPNQGLSVWHSVGEAADQEVPHLHIHVPPRILGDQLLRIYPEYAPEPDQAVRDSYAAVLRAALHLTLAQRDEPDRRLDDYEADEKRGPDTSDVLADIRRRLRR
jgi:diadenosine tetraphosphate (Ap4A) HIT family hydrolase